MNTAKTQASSPEPGHVQRGFSLQILLTLLTFIVISGLYLYHLYVVWTFAVDVPYRDEWDALSGLTPNFSLDWLFGWHNEHRLVTTKLMVWILYRLNHWDLVVHQVINFLIFGVLLFTIGYWARRMSGLATWVIASFLLFLLSPLIYENHLMGYQSQVHFALLFFVAALYLLFDESQTWPRIVAGSLMSVLSIYSLSSGIVTSLVLLAFFAVFKLSRLRDHAMQRKTEVQQLAVVSVLILLAIGVWFIGYQKVPGAAPNALPFTIAFWNYFLNIVSFGFGIEALSPGPGVLCLLIVLVPVMGDMIKRRTALPAATWGVFAGILGILSVLAIIAMGRANGFGIEQSKSSRYAEIGMLLIPLSAMAWSLFLHDKPKVKSGVLTALWIFCFATFLHTWPYFSIYQAQFTERTAAIECVERYYNGRGRGNCRALYPSPIPHHLDKAKELDLSFYRNLRSGQVERITR